MTTTSNRETHIMKLREWIPIDKLDWSYLSSNPNAIHLLEKHLEKVIWVRLSLHL
jgi:hypothetical protein